MTLRLTPKNDSSTHSQQIIRIVEDVSPGGAFPKKEFESTLDSPSMIYNLKDLDKTGPLTNNDVSSLYPSY